MYLRKVICFVSKRGVEGVECACLDGVLHHELLSS